MRKKNIKIINEPKKSKKEIVKMLLDQDLEADDELELIEMLIDNPITIDVDRAEEGNLSFGDKVADKVSEIAGSWGFIISFVLFLLTWIVLNVTAFSHAVDPYPFILLNLVLSCVAALQAPIIMMSQNRQSEKDRIRNQNDYRIDLKSELILEELHREMEMIRKNQAKIIKMLDDDEEK